MSRSYLAAATTRARDVLLLYCLPAGYAALVAKMPHLVRSLLIENSDPALTDTDELLEALEEDDSTSAWAGRIVRRSNRSWQPRVNLPFEARRE